MSSRVKCYELGLEVVRFMKRSEGILALEGVGGNRMRIFDGWLFGAPVSADSIRKSFRKDDKGYGEIVFNTSMTGYQEILTDPSYYGQIICMTCPHIGNTGVNLEDLESARAWAGGFVVHEIPEAPSNWRSTGTLDGFLNERGIPGIAGIDTRALTRHLRSQGVMRGVILPASERDQAERLLAELPDFEGRDLIKEVTTSKAYDWKSEVTPSKPQFKVVAIDFGVKWNLLRCLETEGCEIKVLPADAKASDVLDLNPDGVFLSNGPGDPTAATYAIETVQKLLGRVPIFGVCMGHQILGLALGGKAYKLKFGHRGGNQPVLDKETGRVEISSHNHGYAIDGASLPPEAQVAHVNLNDKTVEGLAVPSKMAFSVQYHPEASPGPHDSTPLFGRFIEAMRKAHVSKVP